MVEEPRNNDEGRQLPPPGLNEDQKAKLDKLLERWNAVQGRLKRAEQISQFAVVPAINELRYAGRMLVAALANVRPTEKNGIPSVDDAIVVGTQYITNAEHDISDALVYFFQKKADDLNQRYGAGAIRKEYPKYGDMLGHLKAARGLVIQSRADLSKRTENYQKLNGITDQIIEEYFSLVDGEVIFALEVEHFKARIKLMKILLGACALWALCATIVAIVY